MPAPPCSTGLREEAGQPEEESPVGELHRTSSAAIDEHRAARGARPEDHARTGCGRGAGRAARSVQASGSRTLRRTQSAKSAGSTPTAKSQRQAFGAERQHVEDDAGEHARPGCSRAPSRTA